MLPFSESVFQPVSPVLWMLGVRGSVCQMAQRAGRPAARGAQEEIREEEEGVTVTSKSELCSAGVLGYVTDILS